MLTRGCAQRSHITFESSAGPSNISAKQSVLLFSPSQKYLSISDFADPANLPCPHIAPIPHAREVPIDTAPHIIEIIRTGPVECMPEKVAEDGKVEPVERAILHIDVRVQRGPVVQRRQLGEYVADGQEDAVDL